MSGGAFQGHLATEAEAVLAEQALHDDEPGSSYSSTLVLRDHPHTKGQFYVTECGTVLENLGFVRADGDINVHNVRLYGQPDCHGALPRGRKTMMGVGPNGGVQVMKKRVS